MPRKKLFSEKENEEISSEEIEDTTMYDEFISSFYSWLPSEVQKEKAKHLEERIED